MTNDQDGPDNRVGGSRPGNGGSSSRSDAAGGRSRDFHEAVDRFERAVEDMVGSASGQFADRAAGFIDQATEQLRREFGGRDRSAGAAESARGDAASGGNHVHIYGLQIGGDKARHDRPPRPASRRRRSSYLYRDTERARIVGVCAGIAAYYGVEPWIVRIIAVTGLLFLPSIVFPAYWVAYFVLDAGPDFEDEFDAEDDSASRRHRRRGHRSRRREARMNRSSHAPGGDDDARRPAGRRSPSTPRGTLRNVSADLTEAELRLRRMESHVTSGQYELQRELAKIDDGRPAAGPPSGSAAAPSV